MKIYGVAVLSICFLAGQLLGDWLGWLFEFSGNIGGVGFAMLLLIICGDWLKRRGWIDTESESGIRFWSGMYIPVVVAMASTQHVKAALQGGWLAVIAGLGGTIFCFLLLPLLVPKKNHSDSQANQSL